MPKVLVCDDNFAIREFCRRELEERGYEVIVAANGREAIDLCGVTPPDVVILDIRMPLLDGCEVLLRLKQMQPGLPVIMHTAHPDEYLRRTDNLLADACIAKDERPDDLIRAVESALARVDRC